MRFGRPGGLEQHLTNQGANLANCDFLAVENKHKNVDLANLLPSAANETPVAPVSATGEFIFGNVYRNSEYRNRARAATVLCLAIAECHRDDAVQILDAALASISVGWPMPPLFSLMDEAAFWSDMASVPELKAYCLNSYNRLPRPEQVAFVGYVQGRASA